MAIDRGVTFLWRARSDHRVRIASLDFPGDVTFMASDVPEPRGQGFWGDYAAAAAWALKERGHAVTRGLDGVIGGALPVGGLSSSAAVGLAYGIAFRLANDIPIDSWDVIRSGLRGENGYVGVNCGLLDFTTICFAQAGKLVQIDCRRNAAALVLPGTGMPAYTIGIVFSGVERVLARSGYNNRVSECRTAAAILGECAGRTLQTDSLIEIPPAEHERFKKKLPEPLDRRAEHFFSEQARVEQGLRAWQQGRLDRFGTLVNESGASSVENYEAGCPEIIELWRILRDTAGVYGTRFSGGGFGGAVIALVDPASTARVEKEVKARYLDRYPGCAAGFRIEFRSSADGLKWGTLS
jgi:galactokinase/galacturonokinase